MTTALAMTSDRKKIGWAKPVLIAGGMVWLIRAGLALVFQPDYWDPQTLLDYVAVAGTSLGLLLLALGVWGIHLGRYCQERREMSTNHRNKMSPNHRLKCPISSLSDNHLLFGLRGGFSLA